MKNLLLLLFALTYAISYAQDVPEDINTRLDVVGDLNTFGTGLWIKSKRKAKVKGDIYLFRNWDNLASVITGQGKKYKFKRINYDTKQDRFVIKTSPDSLFVFSAQSIKQVKLNNKIFKRYFKDDLYSYLELIAFGKGKEVLKKSFKIIKKGIKDPFTNTNKSDEYVLKTKYFLNSESGLRAWKLRKKDFLKFFGEDSNKIKEIIATHKLSLKKDSDLIKIFEYYKNK